AANGGCAGGHWLGRRRPPRANRRRDLRALPLDRRGGQRARSVRHALGGGVRARTNLVDVVLSSEKPFVVDAELAPFENGVVQQLDRLVFQRRGHLAQLGSVELQLLLVEPARLG